MTNRSSTISTDNGQTSVRVIHTDEEWIIAKIVIQIINLT
jgi:acetate kinase